MIAGQIFEEVKRLESIGYSVVLTSDSCTVYDSLSTSDSLTQRIIIDADFSTDMEENAIHALDGLFDKIVAKHNKSGELEQRLEKIKERKKMAERRLPRSSR